MSKRIWSKYSLALFDAFTADDSNIIVQACPGAGKTTNIEHLWSMTDKSTLYVVFNKQNQLEALEKLPLRSGSDVLTLNGLGHRAVISTFKGVKLDSRKVINIIRQNNIRKGYGKENTAMQYTLKGVVDIAKGVDCGEGLTFDMYEDIVNTYDIEEYPSLYDEVLKVLEINDNMTGVIDYNDQLRFPVIHNLKMPQYEVVLGDEVQDFNAIQAALIHRLQAKRYVLVGDKHQGIYGFRGAMNNSMSVLKDRFNCIELPLSITYRCAKDIVKEAAAVYKDIEPWENSPRGIVRYGVDNAEQYTKRDIILCRLNRPLIAMAYKMLQRGTACYVRGRSIGDGLVRLVEKQGALSVRELIKRLNEEYAVESEKARVKEDEALMQRLEDKYSSALLFCQRCKLDDRPNVVVEAISMLFSEGKGVCLSTVHRAKGLEADRAIIIESATMDSFAVKARQQWQHEQERNIKYVAITRAKSELVYA